MSNPFANIMSLAWLVLTTTFVICVDVFDVVCEHVRTSRDAWKQQDRSTGSYGSKGK
jgi:hypothetical protein